MLRRVFCVMLAAVTPGLGLAAKEKGAAKPGQILKVAKVVPEGNDAAVEMVFKPAPEGREEKVFVAKEAVFTEQDVRSAFVQDGLEGIIQVRLTKKGGKKLAAATKAMDKGKDRMALVVEGKLVAAPVVQDTLTSRFIITGLRDLKHEELESLAQKMSRKKNGEAK